MAICLSSGGVNLTLTDIFIQSDELLRTLRERILFRSWLGGRATRVISSTIARR